MQIQVKPGLTVEYIEQFYTPDEADEILRAFLALAMMPEVIRRYGHDIVTKRRSIQYGVTYAYNPGAHEAQPLTTLMRSIRERVEIGRGANPRHPGAGIPKREGRHRLA